MKYFRLDYLDNTAKELTYEKALEIVLGTFEDSDLTHDMLTTPNRIKCRYSIIAVTGDPNEDGLYLVPRPGLYNLIPDGAFYDESGTRI